MPASYCASNSSALARGGGSSDVEAEVDRERGVMSAQYPRKPSGSERVWPCHIRSALILGLSPSRQGSPLDLREMTVAMP
jgi:hypothetical protein